MLPFLFFLCTLIMETGPVLFCFSFSWVAHKVKKDGMYTKTLLVGSSKGNQNRTALKGFLFTKLRTAHRVIAFAMWPSDLYPDLRLPAEPARCINGT